MAMTGYWRYVRNQLYLPRSMPLSLSIWVEQMPQRQNRITLAGQADRLGSPMAHVDWQADASDDRTFRACLRRLEAYWERAGLARACPVKWSQAALDEGLSIAAGAEDLGHPSGTTRMGTDPSQAVVAPDLACHHIGNAWVASASVFPSMGSANPTYTIIQIALRAADALGRRLGSL